MTDALDLKTAHNNFKACSTRYKKRFEKLGNEKFILMQKEGEVHKNNWAKTQTGEMTMASFNQILKHETWEERMNVDVARTTLYIAKQDLEDAIENLNVLKKLISIR